MHTYVHLLGGGVGTGPQGAVTPRTDGASGESTNLSWKCAAII